MMAESSKRIDVYLEMGKKRTFAGAMEWPGWCRAGRDEAGALGALFDYGPRYARVLSAGGIEFQSPATASTLAVVERLEGNSTTDFGAPAVAPSSDTRPVDDAELERFQRLLKASWGALDAAVQAAGDRELRKGPRGGGRDLEGIVRHVMGAEANYLARLAWKPDGPQTESLEEELARTRQAVLDALAAAAHGQTPASGPRGGAIWPPRYFVRRVAWHVLDHAWEIEDRVV
jgi:hypothetical protein